MNNTHLPCRHMLAIREKKQRPLFANGLVAQRWTLDHMKTVYDHKTSDINPESFQVAMYAANIYWHRTQS